MLSKEDFEKYRQRTIELFSKADIVITEEEKSRIEIADFGLGQFEQTGWACWFMSTPTAVVPKN